jgi:hypothetical protein
MSDIIPAIISGSSALGLIVYFKVSADLQRKDHTRRLLELRTSDPYERCSTGRRTALEAYVFWRFKRADRKRLTHETLTNSLAIIGGGIPLLADIVRSEPLGRVSGSIAAVTILILRVLQSSRNATENKTAADRLDTELANWMGESGPYLLLSDDDQRFAHLMVMAESGQSRTRTGKASLNKEELTDYKEVFDDDGIAGDLPYDSAADGTAVDDVPTPMESSLVTPPLVIRPPATPPPARPTAFIAPLTGTIAAGDFAGWQQRGIDATPDDEDPITQSAPR